ncbi:MAG: hypothetical protein AB7V14_03705 [Kiritimatiellia bacterium]
MKKTAKIAVGILVVLALVFVVLELSLDKMVLKGVNAAGPAALGVPVTLEDADISLVRGKASLKNLHVGNPEGYKTDGLFDLGSISVDVDNASLLSDTIVVRAIAIEGMALTFEKGLLDNNLNALIEQLSAGKEEEAGEEGDAKAEKSKKEKKPAKKVVIEKLSITGSQMNFSITGAAALTGGGAIPIPLPPITLTDLGKEKEGMTPVEAVQSVLKAILGAAGTAIAGAGDLLGDAGKAVGEGALAVGEGAVDAGKAVVGGTVDAGKAVVGGTVDAGKAVVDGAAGALKAINPFDEKD